MRITIIGAGNSGRQLAMRLCEEHHSVVMIDTRPEALQAAENDLDVLTLCGDGSSPAVLSEAKAEKSDLFIAVTYNDEINILACLFAHSAGVPHKIARVTNPQYIHPDKHYDLGSMGIDLVINQKKECAREICSAISLPGAVELFDLYEGRVTAAGFRVAETSPILKATPATMPIPELIEKLRIIAIRRDGELVIPHGETTFEAQDCLYLVGAPEDTRAFSRWLNPGYAPLQKVIIAGGGDIGLMIAQLLEETDVATVLMEQNEDRARLCSSNLNRTLVLKADALGETALDEAGIKEHTAFVAVTGDDENNVMNCLMARKKGVDYTITRIARTDYVPVVESLHLVDRVISPYISTTHGILHYLRSQNVQAASLLHNLPGELLDIVVTAKHRMIGRAIQDIKMREALIACVLRDKQVLTATGSLTLAPDDRLLVFADPAAVKKIQTMFLK